MPGFIDFIKQQGGKVGDFVDEQKGNWGRARANEDAGRSRNPWLKTEAEQFNMANADAGAEPSPSSEFAPKNRIAKNTGFGLTQKMMRDFNPEDSGQILQMQQAMNAAGIKGADGKSLAEDGKFGPNTLRALRFAQGQTDIADSPEARELQSYGEPQGGVGPSYDNIYNEDSRDAGVQEANPPSNKVMNWLHKTGMVRKSPGPGGRMQSYGGDVNSPFYGDSI
jgi:hypothetical protein